jgi:outer membrane lipoprotein-sorting protein
MSFYRRRSLLPAIVLVLLAGGARPVEAQTAAPAPLTAAQIVDEMQRHNQERTEMLKDVQSIRHYQVEYRGFSKVIDAKMEVEYHYNAATGKSLRIVTQSGSKMLCEKVLKRAVESEKEASQDKAAMALTAANYRFSLVGTENVGGRPAYLLEVEPLVASKFRFKGKIWVDAAEYALVKMEVEPAKNPSFWITRTRILQTFTRTGEFWLPEQNRSESKVRIGGTAVFMIDYGTYRMESNAAH